MKISRLALLLLPLVLAACGLSPQEKADYATVQASGVSPAIYDKMVHGDSLSIGDIKALAHSHVNDGVTLRYLRNNETVYNLSAADVDGLRKAGVSDSIIDYMLDSSRLYYQGYGYPGVDFGFGFDPFWYGYPYGYYGGGYYRGGGYYHGGGHYHGGGGHHH